MMKTAIGTRPAAIQRKEMKMDFRNFNGRRRLGHAGPVRAHEDIAENIANANSTSPTPGGDPYRRKIATVDSSSTANWAQRWSRPASGHRQERLPQPI